MKDRYPPWGPQDDGEGWTDSTLTDEQRAYIAAETTDPLRAADIAMYILAVVVFTGAVLEYFYGWLEALQ